MTLESIKRNLINATLVSVLGASVAFSGAVWLQNGLTYETEQGTVTVSTQPLFTMDMGE